VWKYFSLRSLSDESSGCDGAAEKLGRPIIVQNKRQIHR
jgi:hypothetical protein